jgi:hypothetical protein
LVVHLHFFCWSSSIFSNDDATMTTNVSVSIKILVSNLVVAALVATYLTLGSKNGRTAGLKGTRQLQRTTFDGRPPIFTSSPIKPILGDFFNDFSGGFKPGPNLPSFSPITSPGIGNFLNFSTSLPPGNFQNFNFSTSNNFPDQVKFTPSKVPSVGNFLSNRTFTSASKVPSVGDFFSNLNFTSSNVPSRTNTFLGQVNANSTSSNNLSFGTFLSTLNFTNSNIFGAGGKNSFDSFISGINRSSSEFSAGKLPPGQGFIQFPSR